MIRKIIGTLSTRIVSSFILMIIVLVNARYLGAAKVGTISLTVLSITIVQLATNFIGGASIVYLLPRHDMFRLLFPSWIWTCIASAGLTWILWFFMLTPQGMSLHVLLLSLLLSFGTSNLMVLMGEERIRAFNIINLLQLAGLFLSLLCFIFILRIREVSSYIWSLYISYTLAYLISLFLIRKGFRKLNFSISKNILKEIFRYGAVLQLGNVFQFFNYRLSYYLVEFFIGRAALGVYTTGVQLSESIWMISKSIHLVQYSRIANVRDDRYAARLTLNLLKVSFVFSLISFIILYAIIVIFFSFIFKPEFSAIKIIILMLSAGILTFSVSVILSPYFAGSGKPAINAWTNATGLVFTLLTSLWFIPHMGLTGAALSASISYTAATLYQLIVFKRVSGFKARDLLIRSEDIKKFKDKVWRNRISGNHFHN